MIKNHDLILIQTEMDEIIKISQRVVEKYDEIESSKAWAFLAKANLDSKLTK